MSRKAMVERCQHYAKREMPILPNKSGALSSLFMSRGHAILDLFLPLAACISNLLV
jgi:hypothetical protein